MCGSKVKIYKEKVFEGHGNHEVKGYIGELDMPTGLINKRKKVIFNQDIYVVKYKYKCTACDKVYDLNEL